MTVTVIADRVLQQVLVEGIKNFRTNPKLMAVLFQSLTDPEFENVVRFLTNTPINFSQNYPRKELTPPSIVLLLKNENESETFLGDQMGTTGLYGMNPAEHVYDTLGGMAASQSQVQGLPKKLIGPMAVTAATANSVTVSDANFADFYRNTISVDLMSLYVVAGAGKGKVYKLAGLGSSSIDIQGTFTVPLDTSSKVDIRESNTILPLGEPVRVFNEDDVLVRRGANFNVTYQLDVIAGSQEEVIYLYSIIKAVLFTYKPLLEAQGIQNLGISGTDFGKKSEYIPDELFTRSLQLSFSYAFSVINDMDVIKELQLIVFPNCGTQSLSSTIDFED